MIGLQIAPLAGAAARPWRNGGGTTRELLAWPGLGDGWSLRVSVAQVDDDGPFSSFDGIERWFAVVSGGGVELRWDDRTRQLGPRSEPACFDGAAPPHCRLLAGPTFDLNLMLRRADGHGSLRRAAVDGECSDPAAWRGLYASGPARLQIGGRHAAELAAAALVWHPYAGGQNWSFHPLQADTLGWWLSFQPHASPR